MPSHHSRSIVPLPVAGNRMFKLKEVVTFAPVLGVAVTVTPKMPGVAVTAPEMTPVAG